MKLSRTIKDHISHILRIPINDTYGYLYNFSEPVFMRSLSDRKDNNRCNIY